MSQPLEAVSLAGTRLELGEYRAPDAALQLGFRVAMGTGMQPKPLLTMDLEYGKEDLSTASYRATPDLIARRLRR